MLERKPNLDKIVMSWALGSVAEHFETAVVLAKEYKCAHVEFPFNGIRVIVTNRTRLDNINEDVQFILECVRDKQDAYL
jgi:hypothetical protein